MLGELAEQSLFFAPDDAALLALLLVPPGLLACYVSYRLVTRQLRPSVSLGPLESIELERSLLLYEMASKRIAADHDRKRSEPRRWRAGRDSFRPSDEAEDLRIYMHDLRSTIVRLRSRPFRRFKHWMHAVSVQSALGRALACYLAVMALVIAWFCYLQRRMSPPSRYRCCMRRAAWGSSGRIARRSACCGISRAPGRSRRCKSGPATRTTPGRTIYRWRPRQAVGRWCSGYRPRRRSRR
jgi:hypothetical protein